MISPYRLYTFSIAPDGSAFNIQWDDYWHDLFENADLVVSSRTQTLNALFPMPPYTYREQNAVTGVIEVKTTVNPLEPIPNHMSVVSVAAMAPALLGISAVFTVMDWDEPPGAPVGEADQGSTAIGVDLLRQREILWDYVISFDQDAPTMVPIGDPVSVRFPGDYRRPGNARTTAILTDDEVFAVQSLAGSIGLAGPDLFGILLVLTGARRNAYHPAGHFGISNLTQSQLATVGVAVTDFVGMSVRGQLGVTGTYLSRLTPAVSGALPVFFTLATGQPQASAATMTTPLTVGGAPMSAAQATALITPGPVVRTEFTNRLPASVSPA